MSVRPVKLPDVGEGVAEAELIEWHVAVGDTVTPESVLASVMTDKATVEISSPVAGTVTALHGEPGDVLAVGAPFVEVDTGDAAEPERDPEPLPEPEPDARPEPEPRPAAEPDVVHDERPNRAHALAAPAVRARAERLGIDLAAVAGTGPDGRVTHADLDRELTAGRSGHAIAPSGHDPVRHEPVRGVRRQIAHRLTAAWTEIPHITYVDAVDVTELQRLRTELNARGHATRLTLLPFVARAVVVALRDQPRLNAHYDHESETLAVHSAVHLGIATQTDDGLRVPVVHHADARSLHELAAEIERVAGAARDGSATRPELTGSTISITSLGALGGLVTTPILNAPEVAIVGVNKIETRPVWSNGTFVPRDQMNLSCSFDHRMVDGWDAATFVQRIKGLLETPALLFV